MASYTKAQLISDVAGQANVTKATADGVITALFDVITAQAKAGTKVSIPGFGSFSTSERSARVGRNPQTGDEIQIPAAKVMKFTAAKGLKDSLND